MLLFRLGFYVFMCVFIINPPTCVCTFISLFYCRPSPICFSFDCFYLLSILLCGFPSERKTAENGRKILIVSCCTRTVTRAPCHLLCCPLCRHGAGVTLSPPRCTTLGASCTLCPSSHHHGVNNKINRPVKADVPAGFFDRRCET